MNLMLLAIFVFGFLVTCSVFLGLQQAAREAERQHRLRRVERAEDEESGTSQSIPVRRVS